MLLEHTALILALLGLYLLLLPGGAEAGVTLMTDVVIDPSVAFGVVKINAYAPGQTDVVWRQIEGTPRYSNVRHYCRKCRPAIPAVSQSSADAEA